MEKLCLKMINKIIKSKKLIFKKQSKNSKTYKRRKPNESKINFNKFENIRSIYNFIRATDVKNYPRAYDKYKGFIIEFYNAKIKSNELYAQIKISKK